MKITIPRAATWPPHVWDTTDPDELAEAEAWVRSLITPAELPPPHPTDMSIAWGITEALIKENAR